MRRRGLVVTAAIAAVAALTPAAGANWHAAAGKLPRHYHLLESASAKSYGVDTVCYGGRPRSNVDEELDCDSNSLTVYTLPKGSYGGLNIEPPAHHVTIRGRPAEWYWVTDEGYRYAREIFWSPRPGLRAAVVTMLPRLGLHNLLDVARHVRALREHDWKLLLRQTTHEAQEGRFEPGMKRVTAIRGQAGGDPWRLDVLIPPDYPLSKDDLRRACLELVYRGEHARGEGCGYGLERVGGQVFVFGGLANTWSRYSVHFYGHVEEKRRGRTYRAPGWSRWKFFARPLPTETCALYIANPDNRDDDGGVYRPRPGTPDYERCGFGGD